MLLNNSTDKKRSTLHAAQNAAHNRPTRTKIAGMLQRTAFSNSESQQPARHKLQVPRSQAEPQPMLRPAGGPTQRVDQPARQNQKAEAHKTIAPPAGRYKRANPNPPRKESPAKMPFDPEEIQAVIFDMDGVLLDSEVLYRQASAMAAEKLGYKINDELHLSTVGIPGDQAEIIIRKAMGSDFPFEEYDDLWREWMAARMMAHVPVKPGVRELLKLLNELEVPIAVATSTQHEPAHHHLMRSDLIEHFATIVTRDDVEHGKPHPEPFLLAAERLEIEPEFCLAIEDSHNGVRSAYAAGMNTIMVPDMLASTPEMERLTIAVLKDLNDVRAVFEGDN